MYKILKIPIIGCGGIFDWKDAVEFFLAGASAVQIGTALFKGAEIISDINKGLIGYLREQGFKSISDLKGLAHHYKVQEVPDFE